jgi:hypothetical protein
MTESSELPQSHADVTDPSTLGETIGHDVRSGDDYPLDEPLGVDDPNIRSDGTIAPDPAPRDSSMDER